ncbi:EVE domain-containing protein [Dyadobacter arcticus]|uniref:RNA-binding protein with PUA-like domain n=1 Tax=Dyadobacter arcticus TaxID=1078754 RepID=A0ABX0UM36_9BACT|nr:EVE domain-containing protein [Dyadobacter arcticus]NIJ53967.1 putative RNA-binding protein with PUA-like domain [Dyadobacter arcticus]
MNHWLLKTEPSSYSWDSLVKEKEGMWDGVRSYAARNNLMAMKVGDPVLFYHSNEGKEVVGLAKVAKEHYPDPTAKDGDWVVVNVVPVELFPKTVTLAQIKADKRLSDMALVKLSRLSVVPVKPEEFDIIVALAHDSE